ncbi:MAG: Fe-S cluster assembly protein SufD [Muribaculaceae bacterium]|nr:Fe-S cluster assembly protein SufD [Muribaculaceae bacterium]
MSPFKQYIDLVEATPAQEKPALLAGLNEAGLAALRKELDARPAYAPLAEVSAQALFAPDYGVNLMRVNLPVDAAASFRCGVPKLNSLLAVVANDAFHPTERLVKECPEGLTVCSLRRVPGHLMLKVSEAMARSIAGGGAPAAANAMLLTDGVLVHVAAGVKIEKAVQIVNIASVPVPSLLPRRVVVIAEEDAAVKVLLCDHSQPGTAEHLCSQVVDVEAAAGASVELYDIEEAADNARRYWQLHASQAERSSLTVNTTALHSGRTHNEFRVGTTGDHTFTSLSGLAICGGSQIVDTDVVLTHAGKHGTSRQLFKNALFEASRGGFSGKIIVKEGAMYTDAEQTNRNIVDGAEARMITAPQLEIYCDEVQCSHGATTGQLDERALFYMQTRGIPADEARRMLTQAFMADVVDNISFEVLRQRLHVLVEKRLSGTAASCDTCANACNTDEQ